MIFTPRKSQLIDIDALRRVVMSFAANDKDWPTIDELDEACMRAGVFLPAFFERANSQARKRKLRQMLRSTHFTDSAGNSLRSASIVKQRYVIVGRGKKAKEKEIQARVYKLESMLTREDFVQVVAYHAKIKKYHVREVKRYIDMAVEKFGLVARDWFLNVNGD